jgi:hypothetical protein
MVFFKGIEFEIKGNLKQVSEEEIQSVETKLGIHFPNDYKDFIMKFGEGEIYDLWITAFSPDRISRQEIFDTRDILSEFWFWNIYEDGFNQEKAICSIPFFGNSGGDIILFHPENNKNWYILPHDIDEISLVHSFQELLNHYIQMCNSADLLLDRIPICPPFKFKSWEG